MCFTLLMSLMSLHVAHVNVLSLKSLTYLLNECWGEYSYPVCVWERERENMCVSNSDTLCSISEWIDVSFDSFWFVVWLIQRVPWLNLLIRWVASLDNVWCDSLCDMCGVTHYVTCVVWLIMLHVWIIMWHVKCFTWHVWCDSRVLWLMCGVNHVCCDSCVLWLMCGVTHSKSTIGVTDSKSTVTWLVPIRDGPLSYAPSCIMYKCHVTSTYVWHDSLKYDSSFKRAFARGLQFMLPRDLDVFV